MFGTKKKSPSNKPFEGMDRKENFKAHMVASSGEFIGTASFLYLALGGTQVAHTAGKAGDINQIMYICVSFGLSLVINAWAFYRISGGLFNPAVVLGMCVSGNLPWMRGVFLIPAQFLGALVGSALSSCMFPSPLGALTTLGDGTSVVQGLFIEMFLTSVLVFTILMLAAEKNNARPVAPLGIGLAFFVCELNGVYFTGGSLNPARSFAPSVVQRVFPHYHWIYWLGPLMGGVLAAAYYRFVKHFNYEEANGEQDETRT